MALEPTHLNERNQPHMVDIANKDVTKRSATATCLVILGEKIMQLFTEGELQTKKGPVIQTAIIAGIMGAKNTPNTIPLCHPLPLTHIDIKIEPLNKESLKIESTVETQSKTGVEMEALTAASTAALTLYDMCKAMSKAIEIQDLKLLKKSGGKSDYQRT